MPKAFRPTTLEHFLAYEEIRQLVLRYAYCVDGGRGILDNAVGDLFTEDGVWDSSDNGHGRYQGENLRKFFSGGDAAARANPLPTWYKNGPNSGSTFLCHTVNAPLILEFTGDEARGVVTYNGQVLFNGADHTVLEAGRYNDHYVRTPDGWKFKERRLEHILPSRKQPLTTATLNESLPGVEERLKHSN
ncbi:MAG: nuclear transport factor 2 family protein [Phenylobacterium sp.]